jgi:hypothetical protein
MATYKLIQDIEAEDHILGPLTLRQFIYALVAAFLYYMCVLLVKAGAAFFLVAIIPVALFFTFFAFPFGKDQSTEVWALAKLRFMLKPRRRIWDQSGMKELVTITAPKKIEIVRTDGLSQMEVESRLSALANTLDSRGWAVKNVNVNAFSQPDPFMAQASDRLIDVNSLPREVPNYEVHASDDILDESSNPVAQQFDEMISQSEHAHRQQIMAKMNGSQPTAPQPGGPRGYWFMNNQSGGPAPQPSGQPQKNKDEEDLVDSLKARNKGQDLSYSHLRTLRPYQPAPPKPLKKAVEKKPLPAVTPAPDPAILSLASNNDLNVATLAREAKKSKKDDEPQDEVVISLR